MKDFCKERGVSILIRFSLGYNSRECQKISNIIFAIKYAEKGKFSCKKGSLGLISNLTIKQLYGKTISRSREL